MITDLDAMVDQPYITIVKLECTADKCWCVAYNPELQGCMSIGDTWQEAIQNLRIARRDYLSTYIENGWEIPQPVTARLENCAVTVVPQSTPHSYSREFKIVAS